MLSSKNYINLKVVLYISLNFFPGYIAAGAIIKQYPDLYLVDTSLDCVQSLTF
jgi:hypothetical protein